VLEEHVSPPFALPPFAPAREANQHRSGNDSRSRVLWPLTRRYPVLRGGKRSHSFLFLPLRFTSAPRLERSTRFLLSLFRPAARLSPRSSTGEGRDDNWREPRRDLLPGEPLECYRSSQFPRPCQRNRRTVDPHRRLFLPRLGARWTQNRER